MNSIYWGVAAQMAMVLICAGLVSFGLYAGRQDKNERVDKR